MNIVCEDNIISSDDIKKADIIKNRYIIAAFHYGDSTGIPSDIMRLYCDEDACTNIFFTIKGNKPVRFENHNLKTLINVMRNRGYVIYKFSNFNTFLSAMSGECDKHIGVIKDFPEAYIRLSECRNSYWYAMKTKNDEIWNFVHVGNVYGMENIKNKNIIWNYPTSETFTTSLSGVYSKKDNCFHENIDLLCFKTYDEYKQWLIENL